MAETTPQRSSQLFSTWYRLRKPAQRLMGHVLIWTIGLFFVVPAIWMLFTSVKSDKDVFRFPPTLLPRDNLRVMVDGQELPVYKVPVDDEIRELALVEVSEGKGTFVDPDNPADTVQVRMRLTEPVLTVRFQWQNFADAMTRGSRPGMNVNFWTYLRNTTVIAVLAIIGTLLSCAPVAYGFARIRWPGRDLVFVLVLSTMMLPYQVTMIPLFLFFTETLRWGDTILPIVVPTFFANAFDIFLLRQFFRSIPEDLMDAARIDGASEFRIFTSIILPLSKPVLATITIFTFLWAWNDFLTPLLYLNHPENFTMALGLQDFQGQRNVAWNQLMAASVVFTVPIIILFFFAQRSFIEGIKLTGTKG
ncbi:MAG: carbohydrate ABC transporter permease [Anaerolineae bacterium]|jgi:multiple sugar transport system permease protein